MYNLHLVILQEAWQYNASGIAYCYEQVPMSAYDPESFQWVALVDVLNQPLWERVSRLCYGAPAGADLRLPRLSGDDDAPRVVIRYDGYARRYLVYPEDQPAAALGKVRLRDALTYARDVAERLGDGR